MKILYISQYYLPDMGAPSARVSELAREWARRGHDVTVLTAFSHHPHGIKQPQDRGVLTRRETDGDVQLVRTYVYAARNAGFFKRIVSYLSFMLSAICIGSWRVGRPDVVIATSPQLFTGVAGWIISKLKWAPFVFEVRDLWPESIVTVGAMRDSFAIRVLKRLANHLYQVSDRIVTVGEGYRRRILQGYPVQAEKIDVVTNGVDVELFTVNPVERKRVRDQYGCGDKTVVLYLGTHGMAHGLDFVLEAAERLRDDPSLCFLFVGDGAEKPKLEKLAAEKGLVNVTFVPPQPKELAPAFYAAADLCLVPLRKIDLFTDVLPSKIFEIMSMERPILLSVDGDARQVVERGQAGVFIEPENVSALCEAIVRLKVDPQAARQMGQNGRRFVEQNYRRSALARRYLTILDNLVCSPSPAGVKVTQV